MTSSAHDVGAPVRRRAGSSRDDPRRGACACALAVAAGIIGVLVARLVGNPHGSGPTRVGADLLALLALVEALVIDEPAAATWS